jgi:hypothetical protein
MGTKKEKSQGREADAGDCERQAFAKSLIDRGGSGSVESVRTLGREEPAANRVCPLDLDHDLAWPNPVAPRESRRRNGLNRPA